MKLSPLAPLVPWIALSALVVSSPSFRKPAHNSRQPQSSDGAPASAMVVYGSDLELDVRQGLSAKMMATY